jgi:hypothetical protein
MEFVNEHGDHSILSQCAFIPFGRESVIDQSTFCSFIRMQNDFLHNVHHVEIHCLADIFVERLNNMDDSEYISNSIRDILLDASDDNGMRLFHSIERVIKSDTIRAIFAKQNQDACNEILHDLDICLNTKFIDANSCTSFRA